MVMNMKYSTLAEKDFETINKIVLKTETQTIKLVRPASKIWVSRSRPFYKREEWTEEELRDVLVSWEKEGFVITNVEY